MQLCASRPLKGVANCSNIVKKIPRDLKKKIKVDDVQALVREGGHNCNEEKARAIIKRVYIPLMESTDANAKMWTKKCFRDRMKYLNLKFEDGADVQTVQQLRSYWKGKPFQLSKAASVYKIKYGHMSGGEISTSDSAEDDEFEIQQLRALGGAEMEYWDRDKVNALKIIKTGPHTPKTCGWCRNFLATQRTNVGKQIDPPGEVGHGVRLMKKVDPETLKAYNLGGKKNPDFDAGWNCVVGKTPFMALPNDILQKKVGHALANPDGPLGSLAKKLLQVKKNHGPVPEAQVKPNPSPDPEVQVKPNPSPVPEVRVKRNPSPVPEIWLSETPENFCRWLSFKTSESQLRICTTGSDPSGWDAEVARREYVEYQAGRHDLGRMQKVREARDKVEEKVKQAKDGLHQENSVAQKEVPQKEYLKKYFNSQGKLKNVPIPAAEKQKRKVSCCDCICHSPWCPIDAQQVLLYCIFASELQRQPTKKKSSGSRKKRAAMKGGEPPHTNLKAAPPEGQKATANPKPPPELMDVDESFELVAQSEWSTEELKMLEKEKNDKVLSDDCSEDEKSTDVPPKGTKKEVKKDKNAPMDVGKDTEGSPDDLKILRHRKAPDGGLEFVVCEQAPKKKTCGNRSGKKAHLKPKPSAPWAVPPRCLYMDSPAKVHDYVQKYPKIAAPLLKQFQDDSEFVFDGDEVLERLAEQHEAAVAAAAAAKAAAAEATNQVSGIQTLSAFKWHLYSHM